MRRFLCLTVIAVVALGVSAQKKKDKQELPDAVLVARYVYVTGWHGNELQFRNLPEERAAIVSLQNSLRDWGRYRVVYHPEEADLMLVVKPGHLGMVQGGVNIGGGTIGSAPDSSRMPTGIGGGYGAEGSSPDDYLFVSISPSTDTQENSYIWRRGQKNGLQGRGTLPLFNEFKNAVDASDKVMAARKKP